MELTVQIVFRQKGLLSTEKRKLLEVEAQQIRNRTYLTAALMRVLSMFDIPKLGSMSPQITKFINNSISKHNVSIMKSTTSLIMFLWVSSSSTVIDFKTFCVRITKRLQIKTKLHNSIFRKLLKYTNRTLRYRSNSFNVSAIQNIFRFSLSYPS